MNHQVNALQIFENPEFGSIRTVELDGTPWLVGKDVAQALGYSNPRDALDRHVDAEDKSAVGIHDGSQSRSMTIINESGLYSLVLASKLPTAKKFRRWVTSEVLPSIRKRGAYTVGACPQLEQIGKMWADLAKWNDLARQFDELAQDARKNYDKYRGKRDECRAFAKQCEATLTQALAQLPIE